MKAVIGRGLPADDSNVPDANHKSAVKKNIILRLLSKHFCLQSFFRKDWVSLLFAKSVSCEVFPWRAPTGKGILKFESPDPWEMHFQHTFCLQSTYFPLLMNAIPPPPMNIML